MTDRTPEQQLADVISPLLDAYSGPSAETVAATIVAAVNSGDIDPIVPEGKVVVDTPPKPHGDWCRCSSCFKLDDVYQRGYDAGHADGYNDGRSDRSDDELAELRALKAKVDSVVFHDAMAVRVPGRDRPIAYADTLLAWLRGPSDG